VVLGTVAASAALVAALVTGWVVASLSETPARRPVPEMELRFSAGDQDTTSGLVSDATGDALPTERFSMLAGGFGSFADYRGKPLVINLFSSNCAPCVAEMPAFEAVHQEVGDDVAFLGLNIQDQVSAASALVEATGVTYDIARDPSGDLAHSLGMVVMPSTYFVSPDGTVVDAKAGAMDAEELRRRIDELRA
jgi:thiol-disulfide isomerase/thioredoxin